MSIGKFKPTEVREPADGPINIIGAPHIPEKGK